ncbi:OCIA domain-containing protein 1-like [Neodiprion virginianus]|uniref:OCIA domain-containing protein 1-like n=1 Tax=Neodiprion virginianus TaxID=2961670 RepID=UPI001EE694DC|nr:OCIA domain-containing protein 1-like [Neodiprion virginianus]
MENVYNNPVDENSRVNSLPKNYQPTPDELKLLAECRGKSNVNGTIGAITFGGLAYQSIKSLRLNVHPRFGIYPKVGVASVVGFFVGKITALPSCREKFKNLPDSPIGAIMRQKSMGSLTTEIITDSNLNFTGVTPIKPSNNAQMNSAIDIDVYNSPSNMDSYTGNELNGPRLDASNDNILDENYIQKPAVSYAELRGRNREDYLKASKEKYNPMSSIANDSRTEPPTRRSSPPPIPNKETNKYGDVWG